MRPSTTTSRVVTPSRDVPEFDDDRDDPDVFADRAGPPSRRSVRLIALFGGALAVVNGPEPTGQQAIDMALTGVAVAAVIWFCSVSPLRLAAFAALVAGCATITWPGLVLGGVSYIAAAGTSVEQRPPRWVNVALVALTLNLASRSELGAFFGASAAIGCGVAALLIIASIPRQTSVNRRRAALLVGAYTVVGAVGVATLASAASGSRADLSMGEQQLREGLDQVASGDIPGAVASFEEAADAFEQANERLGGPLPRVAAIVPVAAQHHRVGVELSAQARDVADTLARELAPIDLDDLTFSDGAIDVDAIASLAEPIDTLREDAATLGATVSDLNDPWLLQPVSDRLVDIEQEIDAQLERTDLFADAVEHVPDMLGRFGPRRYFVAFTTPSEARGLGGFMGNWAELTIDRGAIELTSFGRTADLDGSAVPGDRSVTGPPDWLERYGPYGFTNGPGGGTNVDPWKNITMSASMASTGEVIAELYPQSGGRPVDGVFALDVFAVAALLELTGPIDLPDDGGEVNSDNAARFFLKDQYNDLGERFSIAENESRIDDLEIVSTEAFERLLEADLPPAGEIIDLFGPLVERGHIAGYAVDGGEQDLLVASSLAGTLPAPDGHDALAVTFNNAIGNKIDFFLRTSATYDVVADPERSEVDAVLELTMMNGSPSDGQPSYVIGNPLDLPFGSNRTLVSVYSRLPLTTAFIDGVEVIAERTTEAGLFVTGVIVDLAPGDEAVVRMEFSGPLELDDGYDLTARIPPTAKPFDLAIAASLTEDGASVQRVDVRRPGQHHVSVDRPAEP